MWCEIMLGVLCAVVVVLLWCRRPKSPAAEEFSAVDAMVATERAKASAAAFSNTLQRRLGMENAGDTFQTNRTVGTFDAYKQNFTSGDVGYGTMMAGFQRPTVLPLGRA